jgi:hypothetical protein
MDMGAFVNAPLSAEAVETHTSTTRARLAPWAPAGFGLGRPDVLDEWLAPGHSGLSAQQLVDAAVRYVEDREAGAKPGSPGQAKARYVMLTFTLRHDATGVYGSPLEELLNGLPVPIPDARFAFVFIRTPRDTVRLVAAGQEHREFRLPEEPLARLRKLGRKAVLLGASVLMAQGRFRSLRGAEVLPALGEVAPHWSAFLRDTSRCYRRIEPDAPAYEPYLRALAEFAEWSWQQVAARGSEP